MINYYLKNKILLLSIFILFFQNSYSNYYTPTGVTYYTQTGDSASSANFYFGENVDTGDSIEWYQEKVGNPHNNEIQDYERGQVGLDSNGYLVLRIDRVGSNLYDSSRVNSNVYNGIKVGSGEKLVLNLKLSYLWQKTVMEIMYLMYPFGLHYGLWVMIKLIIHQLDGHIVRN